MGIVEVFGNDLVHMFQRDPEDLLSLLAFIAQQPVETIVDIESTIKLVFSLISELYQNDFHTKFLDTIHNLKHGYILGHNQTHTYTIDVNDKFMFKTLLILSLKYRKDIFVQCESSKAFIQAILQDIMQLISLVKYQSLYILKFTEMILKKREDVLTPDLSLLLLKSMNKASYSPLPGFKNCAHNVSRIVLRSLPYNTKKYLCHFHNLPIKGIDLNDILKQCDENDILLFFDFINKQILKLFFNNTDSRDGSFYHERLIEFCNFDEFKSKIWPYYVYHFQQFDEGEFYQSFLKYWIPITVKHYRQEFFMFIANKDVDYQLKAYTLLEIRKKGFYKPQFNRNALDFLKYPATSNVGLKIICTYNKKQVRPDEFEIKAVEYFLNHYSRSEFPDDVLKSLKQLISQIFLVCHIELNKSGECDLGLYIEFLNFFYKFCLVRISGEDNFEIASQLLKIVWDIASGASSDLVTCYKVDKENTYEVGTNLVYGKLNDFWKSHFLSKTLVERIQNLIWGFKHCTKLFTVVKERYLELINLENFPSLVKLLHVIQESVCLQSSEKIRAYADLMIAYRKFKEDEVAELCKIFTNKIVFFDPRSMFECVLILDMLVVVLNYEPININVLLKQSLIYFEKIFTENISSSFNVKDIKVLESLINNVIECLTISRPHWDDFHKEDLLDHFCNIIQFSNMKRPVSLSANFINVFGRSMENHVYDKTVKTKLLYRVLNSLYHNKQDGKIRRNPETRLVIHALCLSDKNLTKPFLFLSLNFMLEILANPLSSDLTLSSTLHSLEVLVSDNSIHQFTLPFIVDIITHCIRLFNKPSWKVRNADLQLLKALIERLLGVSLDESVRPKTIEDVFVLFPALISQFYEILAAKKLDDSAVLVLLFFSESQIKNDFFLQEEIGDDFEKFRHLFVDIIKKYSNNVGFLAIKAFVALCSSRKLPFVFSEIVSYIQRNFRQMEKNIFANLIKLLQELYHKNESLIVQTDGDVVCHAIDRLVNYLQSFDCFYFNLLSLKLHTVEDLQQMIFRVLSNEVDHKTRIWLNNYIPYVFMETDYDRLESLLNMTFSFRVPDFLQLKILSILVDRCNDEGFPISQVVRILISKLTTLSDDNKFLIMAYAKTILLYSDLSDHLNLSNDTIAQIKQNFETDSIYKVFIYVLALAQCNCEDSDYKFVRFCVKKYIDALGEDDEVLLDLSTTIKHLYKIVSVADRYSVIKLIFYLLLNESTSTEMCKFMSWLTRSHCSSVLISFVSLLNYTKLTRYVGEKRLAVKLLWEFYRYVDDLRDDLEESDTYYLIENDCSISKHYVKTIILKSLDDCDRKG